MTPIGVNIKQTKAIDTAILIIVIVVAFIILYSMYKAGKLFSSIGNTIGGGVDAVKSIWGGDTDTKKAAAALSTSIQLLQKSGVKNPFDARFLDAALKKGKLTFYTNKTAEQKAAQLWNSVGRLKDDPIKMLSVFRQTKNQAQVASIANAFYRKYKKDLLTWLYEKFDTKKQAEALIQAIDYVIKLPVGYVGKNNYNGELFSENIEAVKKMQSAYFDGNKANQLIINSYLVENDFEPLNFDNDGD